MGREGAFSYIVSELLEGETLRDRLHRLGALSERHKAILLELYETYVRESQAPSPAASPLTPPSSTKESA